MWMNKSLKYGVLILPYWPMKAWWATRKFFKMAFFDDFPVPPEGHETARIHRSYIRGGWVEALPEGQQIQVAHH